MNERIDDPIVEVIEVVSQETANCYLDDGWVLLCTGFTHLKNGDHQEAVFLYSLGRPHSVRNVERDRELIERNLRRINGE